MAGLPLVVHTREAEEDTARILGEEQEKGAFAGVLHCFSSTRELAERAIEMGLYISFSGVVTFKKTEELRATAAVLPLDRILVETDAPYLAPVPKRGKRNEPSYVAYTANEVARARAMDAGALGEATTDNFFRLFTKARPQ
jgi:TatD DNase family protein